MRSINDMFGQSKNRGQGVLKEAPKGSRWGDGVEGRTVSIEDATLYVFKAWMEREDWKTPPLHHVNWRERRRQWDEEGVRDEDQIRMEGELVVSMLRKLPVFVLKGLGAYYSATQLKYATGTNAHVVDLYRYLRDSKRKGGREKEEGEEDAEGFMLEESLSIGGRPEAVAPDPGLLRAIGYEGPLLAGVASDQGGAGAVAIGTASGPRPLAVRFGELCRADRAPSDLAKVVVRAAVSEGLAIEEAMNRAVCQFEAAGGDHFALRRRFVQILADAINDAPSLPAPEESAEGFGERREGATPQGFEGDTLGRGRSTSGKTAGEEETEWGGDEESGEAYEDESEEDDREIDLEEGDELGPRWLSEKEGRDTYGGVPTQGLGDMGRGFWEDFQIPEEAVMMQTSFDEQLAEKYASKNNLWKLSVLSKFLPVTIPFNTPAEEVFFAEGFVRGAIPGFVEHGRSLSVQALHVANGAPVEATDHATNAQLRSMVWARRGESGLVEGNDDGLFNDEERAVKRGLMRDKDLLGDRAELEVSIAGIEYKRQRKE